MWVQLMTETVLGALTGYITNHTAIQSLFKPGGVIEQTRDDFAREAGALLEEQVLTEAILLQRLQEPAVKEELQSILREYIQKRLPECLEEIKPAEMPGVEEQIQYLTEMVTQWLERNREILCLRLNRCLKMDVLFSTEQQIKMVDGLYQMLQEVFTESSFLSDYLDAWQKQVGGKTLTEANLNQLLHVLLQNVAEAWPKWIRLLDEKCGEDLKSLLKRAIETLDIGPVLENLDRQIAETSYGTYFHVSGTEMQAQLEGFLQSDTGMEFCTLIANHLTGILEEIDTPPGELLPDSLMDKLSPMMQEAFPFVVSSALNWVRDNREAIGHMLDSAITEVAEEVGNMRGNLLLQMKDNMMDQLLNSDETYVQIYEMLVQEGGSQAATERIMAIVQNLLLTVSVKDLIGMINRNQMLEKALPFIVRSMLNGAIHSFSEEELEKLLDQRPEHVHLAEYQSQLEEAVSAFLAQGLYQMDAEKIAARAEEKLLQMKLNDILPMTSVQAEEALLRLLPELLQRSIAGILNHPQRELIEKAESVLEKWLRESGYSVAMQFAEQNSLQKLAQPLEQLALEHLDALTETVIVMGVQATAGQLSVLAENQIQNLSNEEMLVLVEDFMGRELQPLNYLGAAMGAGVGATVGTGLSLAIPEVSMVPMAVAGAAMVGKLGLFGAVGYSTNCAAVKGLFWPYEPVGGMHWAQGVIPKQKDIFSHSLGQLVNRYVINPEILGQIIKEHAEEWNDMITLAAEDPAALERLSDAVLEMRGQLSGRGVEILTQNTVPVLRNVLERTGRESITLPPGVLKYIPNNIGIAEDFLNWGGIQLLHSRTPLSRYLSGKTLWSHILDSIKQIKMPDTVEMVHRILNSRKSPELLFGCENWNAARNALVQFTERKLLQTEIPEQLLTKGFLRMEEKINATISGRGWLAVYSWLESNLVGLLKQYQALITQKLTELILSKLNMFLRMGFSMIQGDELVFLVVDRVLNQKLPIFMSVQKNALESFVRDIWQQQLSPILQEALDETEIRKVMHGICENATMQRHLKQFAEDSFVLFGRQPICSWGTFICVDRVVTTLQNSITLQLHKNGEAVVQWITPAGEKWFQAILEKESLSHLTGNGSVERPAALLLIDGWEEKADTLMQHVVRVISDKQISNFLVWDVFCEELLWEAESLMQEEQTKEWLRYEAGYLIDELARNAELWIPAAWRKQLAVALMPSILQIMAEKGPGMLGTMDLSGLAEEQLKQMDSAHLEDVVRGFAQSYLTHIERRGWYGAIFAIPGILLYLI